jgi:hypothetical protein
MILRIIKTSKRAQEVRINKEQSCFIPSTVKPSMSVRKLLFSKTPD